MRCYEVRYPFDLIRFRYGELLMSRIEAGTP